MIKHKSICQKLSKVFLVLTGCFILLNLTGCSSIPNQNKVKAVDLLSNQSGLYFSIPAKVDDALVEKIIEENTEGLSKAVIKNLIQRFDRIYLGLNNNSKDYSIQVSVDSRIPKGLYSKVLTKKDGWNVSNYSSGSGFPKYKIYKKNNIIISAPNSRMSCISIESDNNFHMENMLDLFTSEITNHSVKDSTGEIKLDSDISDYLLGAKNEIRFYMQTPQKFLSQMFNTNVDLKLIDVCGSFRPENSSSIDSENYILNISFNFKNEKFLKAGKAVLRLVFGLSNGEYNNDSKTLLTIMNLKINKNQIYTMFEQ